MTTNPQRQDPKEIRRRLHEVQQEKMEAIEKQDFHKAAELREQETELAEILRELERPYVFVSQTGSAAASPVYEILEARIESLERKLAELEKKIKNGKRPRKSKPRKRKTD